MTLKQKNAYEVAKSTHPKYAETLRRLFTGGGSRSDAIKLKCLDCAGWLRPEVAGCTVEACPLWNLRPYQGTTDAR